MCVCVCVCVCVNETSAEISAIYARQRSYVKMYVYVCKHICMHMYECVCVYVCVLCICMYVCVCTCVCVCVCVHLCVCERSGEDAQCNTLQHTATHCNTRQHTTTHGNTRQHTAQYEYTQCTKMQCRTFVVDHIYIHAHTYVYIRICTYIFSCIHGLRGGGGLYRAARPLDRTRVMRTVQRGECHGGSHGAKRGDSPHPNSVCSILSVGGLFERDMDEGKYF